MKNYFQRARGAYSRFGAAGLFPLGMRHLRAAISRVMSTQPNGADSGPAFDRTYGTETCRRARLHDLTVVSANTDLGIQYEPTAPSAFAKFVKSLNIACSEYKFVDYGCGKGRVLLLAAKHGFRTIIGVEFSKELCEIARSNVIQYKKVSGLDPDISIICTDASVFEVPGGNCVLYFYHPFQEELMRRVLPNIKSAIIKEDRDIIIVYHNPQWRRVLDREKCLRKYAGNIWSTDWYVVYRGVSRREWFHQEAYATGRPDQNS